MMRIEKLPFFYKSHYKPDNGNKPHVLPFKIFFDKDLKMFRQEPSSELNDILRIVYEEGSLVDGSISSESGRVYISQLIDYIRMYGNLKENSKVLEVGCGSGLLLQEVKKLGVKSLTGIEPGKHTKVKNLEDIKIFTDFFPSPEISGKFDLIYSFCVLEHIEDPVKFVQAIKDKVTDEGKIIIGVPNCEPFLAEGDISIFIHEHFNYFTQESLISIIEKASLKLENISIIEGMYILTASISGIKMPIVTDEVEYNSFFEKTNTLLNSCKNLFNKYAENDIAIYVPGRALNTLYLSGKRHVRLIDDNSEMHGKYLPYFSNPVESLDQISKNPPKCILIFSRTFGKKIKNKCRKLNVLNQTAIYTISDFDE